MIEIKSLRVDYENVTAVSDVSLVVEPGRVFGLVGPNGSGKTSLLKAIAGLVEPTYGDIKICGFDLELNPQEALQKLGFMPDFNAVYENLKVWEYLDVFATAYLIERKKRMGLVEKWVNQVGLGEKTDAFIHTLSRGMRQRLVLARTLIHDPEVALLDEPASGIDALGRIEMRDTLKEAARGGKAIIISSHILSELSDLCDSAGIMEKGRMVVSGDMARLREYTGMKTEIVVHLSEASDETIKKLKTALEGRPGIGAFKEEKKGEFSAEFSGSRQELPGLLGALIKEGLPVAQFFIREAGLEDIYFKAGTGKTS